jgi:demethylspheroidene O-methyltransferase
MRDHLLAIRDRILLSTRFQRLAAAFPLTRPIANAQAQKAFDLCAGFVYSQITLACVRLGVLDAVRDGVLSIDVLAARAGLPLARARVLVNAAAAIGLLSLRSRDRIGLGMKGAAIVANPAISALIEHHALLYDDLSDPVAVLRGREDSGRIRRFWPYAAGGARGAEETQEIKAYCELMGHSQELISNDIIAAVSFAGFGRILDIGGGDGTFLAALARSSSSFSGCLFDLPAVADRAGRNFEAAGLSDRCEVVGGDFLVDQMPSGFDAATLVRVLHDHDDGDAARLLSSVCRGLQPGGTVIIAEPMSGIAGTATVADAYFGFYLMAMGSGRPRRPDEISSLLIAAGFRDVRIVRTRRPLLVCIVIAQSPK